MTMVLSYVEATRVAVGITLSNLPAPTLGTVTATAQRSRDGGIAWTTVRGLAESATLAGVTTPYARVDDYEFAPDILNTYRYGVNQSVVDTFTRTVVAGGWGTADTGNVWTGTAAQLSVSTLLGRVTHDAANQTVTARLAAAPNVGDFTAEVTLGLGVVATVAAIHSGLIARYVDASNMYEFRLTWGLLGALTLNIRKVLAGVTTTIATQALVGTYTGSEFYRLKVDLDGSALKARCWKTTDPEPLTWTLEVTDASIASGQLGAYSRRETANTNVNPVTTFNDLVVDDANPVWLGTDTITPTLSRPWLKSCRRVFLNQDPMVVGYTEPSRDARGGESEIVGRTLAVAQEELMSGRRIGLQLRLPTVAAARNLEWLCAGGDVIFLQVPADCEIPGGYYRVDGMSGERVTPIASPRIFELPLREVAAPGPDVVAATMTWESLFAIYGNWDNVAAAFPTGWDAVLAALGTPTEVIVE